jgi:hypothetical protein
MCKTVSPDQEEIIYAVCDIEAIIGPKLRHDLAGQYNRFDVLSLKLNRAPCRPIIETEDVLPTDGNISDKQQKIEND